MPPAPYSIPYRALYSKNVENLYFAGRNISMTHMAMSSIRVMATCALLGEAVGKAASIAVQNNTTPHGVYLEFMDEVQELLLREDCYLPSKRRTISDACLQAKLEGASDVIRNGEDRSHRLYGTNDTTSSYSVNLGDEVVYSFEERKISGIHLTFDSDLNRKTLPGSDSERLHSMRSNYRLDSPIMHMPLTLCREFSLYGELNGERTLILNVKDNRKRAYDISINQKFDRLILVPERSWGNDGKIAIISFDFS